MFDGDWEFDITEELERIVRFGYVMLIGRQRFVPQLLPLSIADSHEHIHNSGREISYLAADQIPQQQQISPIIAGEITYSLADALVTFPDNFSERTQQMNIGTIVVDLANTRLQ